MLIFFKKKPTNTEIFYFFYNKEIFVINIYILYLN